MSNLKTDKTALEKESLRMTRRIEELELQIGHEDENLNWFVIVTFFYEDKYLYLSHYETFIIFIIIVSVIYLYIKINKLYIYIYHI